MTQIKVTPVDKMGTDLSVVNAARVSFGKQVTSFKDSDAKLIKYLASHEHMSPFGHCFASFHIKAPLFVARQLVKHKFLRWNEISRRYVDDEPEFFTPEVWRGRSEDKKQGSEGTLPEDIQVDCEGPLREYERLLDLGVAPEQARMVLPQSMMTEWYWSGSLDAFSDMCLLRTKDDTQEESRIVAQEISDYMGEWFPVSWLNLQYD